MHGRVLVVANQTLGGEELAATVRKRVEAGATELWIVVPATSPPDDVAFARVVAYEGRFHLGERSEGADPVSLAERRLKDATYRFDRLGITVGGEVGDEDPFQAVSDVLSKREFDEVIVSTLPTGVSHWLRADLPSKVHRKFKIPVTTVTSHGGRA
jgi:hypothetical protein